MFLLRLEEMYVPFLFLFLWLIIQRMGYSIQHTVKKLKKKIILKKEKLVEKVLKKYGKRVETEVGKTC